MGTAPTMIDDLDLDRLALFCRLYETLEPVVGCDRAMRCAKAAERTASGMPAPQVAEWLGCSLRTVWADLALVRQLIAPEELRAA